MSSEQPDSCRGRIGRHSHSEPPFRVTIVMMHSALRWLRFGVLLELIVLLMLFSVPSNDSTTPAPAWQTALGYTQMPGGLVLGVLATLFGHSLGRLPSALGHIGVICLFAIAFLVQSAILWFPVWGVSTFAMRPRRIRAD